MADVVGALLSSVKIQMRTRTKSTMREELLFDAEQNATVNLHKIYIDIKMPLYTNSRTGKTQVPEYR